MKYTKIIFAGLLAVLSASACQTDKSFLILEDKDIEKKMHGFINEDTLQVFASGRASREQEDPTKAREEAHEAALIRSRISVVDYILFELQQNEQEKFQSLAEKTGAISINSYERDYSPELLTGKGHADNAFEVMGIRGYIHEESYNATTREYFMTYRVVQAGLRARALNGFQ